ncbi:Fur family transcriptional regulator [Caldinitratiruptor microaerophilus]|uniref:Transcriptional repressor n=1 Tax=Caldinitratiruptor microaerophilus TaxID=671077 RepID=A0AA35CNB7_9FIRM|nr:transcriptional repressor [Caldinitratiruptor microaerophilus]BDG62287.1 hypothetical protein caldi_33770 [Caldinitratiruptor microaerophilus]
MARPSREERYQELCDALEAAGLKLTNQRRAICAALASMTTHPTVYEVHEYLRTYHPTVSRATVYNTLTALRDLGLVAEIGPAGDGAMHYELNPDPHLNLVCVRCHRIVDLPGSQLQLDSLVRNSGFRVTGARLALYGYCPSCQRQLGWAVEQASPAADPFAAEPAGHPPAGANGQGSPNGPGAGGKPAHRVPAQVLLRAAARRSPIKLRMRSRPS